jgi:SOS response regulatory protein OraA/RecX
MTQIEPGNAALLRIRRADKGARVLLCVQTAQGEQKTLKLFTARLPFTPKTGMINETQLQQLEREERVCNALTIAMRALAAGNKSKLHLMAKLTHRGVEREDAAAAVRELTSRGLLDEGANAMRAAESGITKLWGNRRILADLRAKGYSEEVLRPVRARLADEDAIARCIKLLHRRRIESRSADEICAMEPAVLRYGYSRDEFTAALQALLG